VVNSTFVPGLRGEKIGISRRTLHRKINEMNLAKSQPKRRMRLEELKVDRLLRRRWVEEPPQALNQNPTANAA